MNQLALSGLTPGERLGFEAAGEYDEYMARLGESNKVWRARAAAYAQHGDKPDTRVNDAEFIGRYAGVDVSLNCSSWASLGECSEGHRFAKQIYCGREWCATCGGNDGVMHNRRKARWLPKAMQIESMGYFVITLPPEMRYRYRSREELGKLGVALRRMLKRQGFTRGLSGWDYFGESENAPAGSYPKWHPHFSALVDGKRLTHSELRAVKRSVARIMGVRNDRVNVYYQYSNETLKKLHWVSYVTRPTFLDWRWDEAAAVFLRGMRTYQAWGQGHWNGPVMWFVPEGTQSEARAITQLQQRECPDCGKEISWKGLVKVSSLEASAFEDVGCGYWRYFGNGPSPGEVRKLRKE